MRRKNDLVIAIFTIALAGCTNSASGHDDAIEKGVVGSAEYAPSEESGWKLAWSDEFDGDSVDTAKWGYDIDCWGGGNEERQCYTDNTRNSALRDGKLVITARQENATGPAFPPHLRGGQNAPGATASKPFTSARLTTRGKASWRYGWIEVRAKLPQGQGTWPAIWMLPEDSDYGTWAASGEIDILEAVNLGVQCQTCPGGKENTVLGTLHFGGVWPDNQFTSTEIALPGSLDEFHTYSIVWREGQFTWLVDGKIYATKDADDWFSSGSDNSNAPFDRAFHIILNLAIGGGLPERRGFGGVSTDGFPKELEVDWVRVWQCENDLANGLSCPMKETN